ncbi:MAG: hypothetical protein JW876_10815, partial [Candidatus Krumholzibacteriota bacterium]|nr:hypothetical protein [Candidatus Krumholzibacteriota bacterium]
AVQINADNSGTGGFVWVARNETGAGIELNGNWGYSEEPRLTLYGSTQSAGFRLDETGDGSVSLPAGAVNSAEILDEPGTAAEAANTSLMLDGTVQAILSRTITAPAAGYVLVVGTCQPRANHTAGTNSFADFGVSDLGTAFPSNQDVEFRVPSTAASGMYCIPATVTGLFAVTSGSHTFHLLGRENSGDFEIFDAQLTLVYLPTAYGTVVETMRMAGDPFDDAAPGRPAVDAGAAALERDASIAADRARVDRELAAMRAELEDVKRLMEEERNR